MPECRHQVSFWIREKVRRSLLSLEKLHLNWKLSHRQTMDETRYRSGFEAADLSKSDSF
jgi:hypothetical protein